MFSLDSLIEEWSCQGNFAIRIINKFLEDLAFPMRHKMRLYDVGHTSMLHHVLPNEHESAST